MELCLEAVRSAIFLIDAADEYRTTFHDILLEIEDYAARARWQIARIFNPITGKQIEVCQDLVISGRVDQGFERIPAAGQHSKRGVSFVNRYDRSSNLKVSE